MDQLIFIVFPEGCEEAGKFDHLNKTLYSLKQSSHEWFKIPAAFLLRLSFIHTYTNHSSSHKIHLLFSFMSTETPSLHPLLVSKMRDKRTTKPTLNAGLLPGRPDMSDGFFRSNWALEMWRIGYKPAHESRQALDLLRSGCGYILIKHPDVAILKVGGRGIHTIRVTAYLHQTRADTHEEHTVFLVLRVELGHNDIHGCLGGSVQRTNINLTIIGQV